MKSIGWVCGTCGLDPAVLGMGWSLWSPLQRRFHVLVERFMYWNVNLANWIEETLVPLYYLLLLLSMNHLSLAAAPLLCPLGNLVACPTPCGQVNANPANPTNPTPNAPFCIGRSSFSRSCAPSVLGRRCGARISADAAALMAVRVSSETGGTESVTGPVLCPMGFEEPEFVAIFLSGGLFWCYAVFVLWFVAFFDCLLYC
jgi:hypothetical protein